MKGLRIGRRRTREKELKSSPLELALRPALVDDRWQIPDRFNFARDVVEALARNPKRQAVTIVGADGVIEPRTFLEVYEGSVRWAERLREHGVRKEDRVLVVAGSTLDWIEIVLGTFKVGGAAVFCPPWLATGALESRVAATEPALVVAERASEPTIAQMSFSTEVHYFDPGVRVRATDLPDHSPTHDTSARDLAFVGWTAGATGPPKGVAHTHGSVFATRVQAEHWLDAGPGDVVWCTARTDSPMALLHAVAGPWSRGAEVVLHQGDFDARDHLDLLYRLGPTILVQSPAEYRALAGLRELQRYRPPRLRRLLSTGDHLDHEIVEDFQQRWGMTIHDGYGQAETNIVVGALASDELTPGVLGHALPGHHVAIIDSDGNELPPGIEGDLAVRGRPPTLFAGYWELPDETRSAFRGDWYVTGDVAVCDQEGAFRFVARAEDVITSSGRTFGPAEVEHALRAHPAVAASAVIGVRDLQRGGHFVRAYVVPARGVEGSEQLEAEVRQFVSEALVDQQVPREIVFVAELPLAGGKVSRHTLRERPVPVRPLWETAPAEPEPSAYPSIADAAPAQASQPVEPAFSPDAVIESIFAPQPVVEPTVDSVFAPEAVEPPFTSEPVFEPEQPAGAGGATEREAPPSAEAPTLPAEEPSPSDATYDAPPEIPEPPPLDTAADAPVEPLAEAEPYAVPPGEPVPESAGAATPGPEPLHTPEFGASVEPAPLPDYVVPPGEEPSAPAAERAAFEAEPEPDAGPLPDYVVEPSSTSESPAHIHAVPDPEPEPEPDLGPLPDYVIDPSRPPERREPPETRAPQVASSPFGERNDGTEPSAAPPGLYFPPVTSFPVPRVDPDASESAPRKPPRRRATADPGTAKRKGVPAEPGDEAEEVGWMQGLSNRLSAYSFSADEPPDQDTPAEDTTEREEEGTEQEG